MNGQINRAWRVTLEVASPDPWTEVLIADTALQARELAITRARSRGDVKVLGIVGIEAGALVEHEILDLGAAFVLRRAEFVPAPEPATTSTTDQPSTN